MRRNGFTLIELMVVLAMLAILSTVAAPAFKDQFARRRLEGVGLELASDLQFARARSVSQRSNTTLTTLSTGAGYTVTTADGVKTVTLPSGMTVSNSITVTYSALRAMADADQTLTLSYTGFTAATMNVSVAALGRVKVCSPGGALTGVVSC